METESTNLKEQVFLDTYVFAGLKNLNNGFDDSSVKYFSANDFEIVLKRVYELGLGVYGIEPWKDGEFFGVVVHEQYTDDPTDSNWYMRAFNFFSEEKENLQFAATYFIPDDLLKMV